LYRFEISVTPFLFFDLSENGKVSGILK